MRRRLHLLALLALAGVAACGAAGLPGLGEALLMLAPALALLASLSLGHHPGEERLARLVARRHEPTRAVRAARHLGALRPVARPLVAPRLLLARSLAERGPPPLALALP